MRSADDTGSYHRRGSAPRLAAGVLIAALAGCSMAPRYQRPDAPVGAEWPQPGAAAGAAEGGAAAGDLGWRDVLLDARLQELVRIALANNRDLRAAALNVELARAQFRIVRADQLPVVSGNAGMSRQRTPAGLSPTGQASTSSRYSASVGTAFELDLFGRARSEANAALETYFATEEARRSAHIALVSEVAAQYLAATALDAQLQLARETLKTVESAYDLTRRSFDAGRTSELDVRTAEAQVQTARFTLSSYQQQRAQAENAMVLLLGQPVPPELPPGEPLGSQRVLSDLPAGLPSDLLQRRPDILQAEHLLRAANARIGAARAAFFPSISLTASGGTASPDLSGLFGAGSGTWSFSPQVSLPIFTGGRNTANLEASHVRKRIEIARYERAIQGAFREVADALAVRATVAQQVSFQEARVAAEQRRYELSELRYRTGVDSYLTVLTAQRDLYTAQQQLIQSRLVRLTNTVDLYAALGGGWLERASQPTAAVQPSAAESPR